MSDDFEGIVYSTDIDDDDWDDEEVVRSIEEVSENLFGIIRLGSMVCDIDVSSMYPSVIMALNISRKTKKCSVIGIEGYPLIKMYDKQEECFRDVIDLFAVERLMGGLIATNENTVEVCNEFFDLPTYDGMDRAFYEKMLHKPFKWDDTQITR